MSEASNTEGAPAAATPADATAVAKGQPPAPAAQPHPALSTPHAQPSRSTDDDLDEIAQAIAAPPFALSPLTPLPPPPSSAFVFASPTTPTPNYALPLASFEQSALPGAAPSRPPPVPMPFTLTATASIVSSTVSSPFSRSDAAAPPIAPVFAFASPTSAPPPPPASASPEPFHFAAQPISGSSSLSGSAVPATFALGKAAKKKGPARGAQSLRPMHITCSQVIQHAARDHTQLYLSLLPADICAEVDSMCRFRWCFEPVLYAVSLPEMEEGKNSSCTRQHLISPDGHEALIDARRMNSTAVAYVIDLSTKAMRTVIIDDWFNKSIIVSPPHQPLLVFGNRNDPNYQGMRLRDLEGTLQFECQDKYAAGFFAFYADAMPQLLDDWLRLRETWTCVYDLTKSYTLPKPAFWCNEWRGFWRDGDPHVYRSGQAKDGKRLHQMWRLTTMSLVWERIDEPPMRGRPIAELGAFILTSGNDTASVTLCILDLYTGAPLLEQVSGYWVTDGDRTDRAIMLRTESGSGIPFWDPLVPHRLGTIDFRGWEILRSFDGIIVAKRGTDDFLFWHFALGCGVRVSSPIAPLLALARLEYRGGAFIATSLEATHVIPMPVNADTRTRLPLPLRLPDNIPVATARALSDGHQELRLPLTPVPQVGGGVCGVAPMFVAKDSSVLWRFVYG